MAHQIFGNLDLQTNSAIVLREVDNVNGITLKAPSELAADLTIILPSSFTANGVLLSSSTGTLSSAKIKNENISDQAQITLSKLEYLNGDRIVVTSNSGQLATSETNSSVLVYLDATSSIQSQLDSKASSLLDNLTVPDLDSGSLLIGVSDSEVASLAVGSEGQILKIVSGTPSWAEETGSVSGYTADWEAEDGTSLTIPHSLGTTDILVQVFDKDSGETILVDSVIRTDSDTLDLISSTAPGESGWRVLILSL